MFFTFLRFKYLFFELFVHCLLHKDSHRGVEVERSPRMREIGDRSPVGESPKLLKQVVTSPLRKDSATGVNVRAPRRKPL